MKRLFVAGVVGAALYGAPGFAADMSAKAPTYNAPPVIAVPTWTGFYLGAHLGGAWGSEVTQTMVDTNGAPFDNPNFGGARKLGALGGAQVGYNWQLAPAWVVGLEGDFSWTSPNNSNVNAPATAVGFPVLTSSLSMSNDVRWLASARGRVGYASDRALFYVTGGAAWSNVSYSATLIALAPYVASTTFTKTNTGWVLGPGIEWLLNPNWAIRAEYLYYVFPSASASTVFVPPCPGCGLPVNFNWSSGNVQVVRLGLDYKF